MGYGRCGQYRGHRRCGGGLYDGKPHGYGDVTFLFTRTTNPVPKFDLYTERIRFDHDGDETEFEDPSQDMGGDDWVYSPDDLSRGGKYSPIPHHRGITAQDVFSLISLMPGIRFMVTAHKDHTAVFLMGKTMLSITDASQEYTTKLVGEATSAELEALYKKLRR